MKPWKTLFLAPGLEGQQLMLQERDGVFVIRSGGRELMSSARYQSEQQMAAVALKRVKAKNPVVLIGGLGLGFTVRATLDLLPPEGSVVVAEISPDVVDWNRGPLAPLAGAPLQDPRVRVEIADVARVVAASKQRFDAVLLDVDLGPSALAARVNQKLYEDKGIASLRAALRPGGVLVVWSAGPDAPFLSRLGRAGFDAQVERSVARVGGSASHVLFIAALPTSGRRPSSR
ncbi:MAG: Spermidine synthase [Myxococcaceae bacterium]|nr:Spermidine synthase [Myxococcaceae bacterium]